VDQEKFQSHRGKNKNALSVKVAWGMEKWEEKWGMEGNGEPKHLCELLHNGLSSK
jgi:hypothetical protein